MGRVVGSERERRSWGEDDSGSPILHVDMDAFFASVELIDRPGLRGRPVIVGGRERGVVLAATYEARSCGVHSAMPMSRARALCPQAVVIPPDHARYVAVSRQVMAILGDVTPVLEQVSIDEAFLDVSGARRRVGPPLMIAGMLRERIRDEVALPASVGIASTMFVAKIASQRAKPDGVLLVPATSTVEFLHALPVTALWGVGSSTAQRCRDWGLVTVGDLARTPVDVLRSQLGSAAGARLHDLAWGRDPRPVTPVRREKSISAEHTFAEDTADLAELVRTTLHQSHRCAARLRSAGLLARGVSIKVRYSDFTTLTRAARLEQPTDVGHEIFLAVRERLASLPVPAGGLRLIGVKVDDLTDAAGAPVQPMLGQDDEEWRTVEVVMDDLARRFGAGTVSAASLLSTRLSRKA